jgi:hypothetical protein
MTSLQKYFDEKQRQLLEKLFRALGLGLPHEVEKARGRIDSLLREFGKAWIDLIHMLSDGKVIGLRIDLVRDIEALGSDDSAVRAAARRNIADLLARHRKDWNDLTNVLYGYSHETWAYVLDMDDPPRVNPLNLVHYLLQQYLAMKPHEYDAVALWALHTHVFDRFMHTPRLVLRSPAHGCGKTRLLAILERLTAGGKRFGWITIAVLLRRIDETHFTTLLDEVHNLGLELCASGRFRALFNTGHEKGELGSLMDHGEAREFDPFAPLALALPIMFGVLPPELNSRSITIGLERNTGQRVLKRLDINFPDPALDAAYLQIWLWQREVKLNPDPEMPEGLGINRIADNWRPLLSIADSLGWGERARAAMIIFARDRWTVDLQALLLSDIRRVFDMRADDRLPSKMLIDALCDLDGAEWCEFRGTKGNQQPHRLKETDLSGILKHFGIMPHTIWPRNRTATSRSAKGYMRADFEQAWASYCESGTAAHPSKIRSLAK